MLKKLALTFAALTVFVPLAAFAQAPAEPQDINKPVVLINPLGVTDPRAIIGNLIKAIISVIGSVTLLMFVYGGVLWITSMGDDKKVLKGKQILVWAVLGLMIIAGAYALTNAVISGLTRGSVVPTAATT
jgi:hypothetical protein